MAIDLVSFSSSLLDWMAAQAGLSNTDAPRPLYLSKAIEGATTDPYSVLAAYTGGSLPWTPVPVIPMQVMTTGTNDADTYARAQVLFNALLDTSSGRPLRDKAITGFKFSVLSARPPGIVGRDEKQRAMVVFNFDARFVAA